MSAFEFIFSLFGLMLGLALAEGLGSLSNAIKARHKVRIGWATALLGILVSCDIVTFWMYGWTLRDKIPVTWPYLFGGFVVGGLCGLFPLLVGLKKRRRGLALTGWGVSVVSGLILGLLLALPVALGFGVILLVSKPADLPPP